jgi:hypothetical protein
LDALFWLWAVGTLYWWRFSSIAGGRWTQKLTHYQGQKNLDFRFLFAYIQAW